MLGRSSFIATSWIALAILFALSPSAAMADCDLLQKFSAVQANGVNVVFELDDVVDGRAKGSAHYLAGADLRQVNGQADGTFDGLRSTIDVRWENGAVGHYEGRIDPASGRLAGATKDLASSPSRLPSQRTWVKWSSKQRFDCVAEPGVSPSTIAASCGEYAKTAVRQNAENVTLHCGFTDARWNSNPADHETWCRDVGPVAAGSHTAARKRDLDKCREQIAQAQRRRLEEKPGVPIGDITKPVDPLDRRGVFEK